MTGPFVPNTDITDPEKLRSADLKARYLNWVTRETDWPLVIAAWDKAYLLGGHTKMAWDGKKLTAEHVLTDQPQPERPDDKVTVWEASAPGKKPGDDGWWHFVFMPDRRDFAGIYGDVGAMERAISFDMLLKDEEPEA